MYCGNFQIWLCKLVDGEVDVMLFVYVGFKCFGFDGEVISFLEIDVFLLVVGQGVICIESWVEDIKILEMLVVIYDEDMQVWFDVECVFFGVLDGFCCMLIGGLVILDGDIIELKGIVLKLDGLEVYDIVLFGVWLEVV